MELSSLRLDRLNLSRFGIIRLRHIPSPRLLGECMGWRVLHARRGHPRCCLFGRYRLQSRATLDRGCVSGCIKCLGSDTDGQRLLADRRRFMRILPARQHRQVSHTGQQQRQQQNAHFGEGRQQTYHKQNRLLCRCIVECITGLRIIIAAYVIPLDVYSSHYQSDSCRPL